MPAQVTAPVTTIRRDVARNMNAVEIEQAISNLSEQPFDAAEFPKLFLQAFGNEETTLKRLRKGGANKSDPGGVLQSNNVRIALVASSPLYNT